MLEDVEQKRRYVGVLGDTRTTDVQLLAAYGLADNDLQTETVRAYDHQAHARYQASERLRPGQAEYLPSNDPCVTPQWTPGCGCRPA